MKEFKSRSNDFMLLRYNMLFDALRFFFNSQMLDEIDQEEFLVRRIDDIGLKLKETKDSVIVLSHTFLIILNAVKNCIFMYFEGSNIQRARLSVQGVASKKEPLRLVSSTLQHKLLHQRD